MSFLASLISGPSENRQQNNNQNNQQNEQKKEQKNETKKGFTHGGNVFFTKGIYKGYHGFVSEFFPATYVVTKKDTANVEVDKYGPLQKIGSVLQTEYGKSTIKKVLPGHKQDSLVQLIVYEKSNIGRVLDKQKDMQLLLGKNMSVEDIENPNNTFVVDVFSAIDNIEFLNMSENESWEDMDNAFRKLSVEQNGRGIIQTFSEKVKSDVDVLENLISADRIRNLSKVYMFEVNQGIKDEIEKLTVVKVFKKDIVGPMYYMNVYKKLGEYYDYDPTRSQYVVSYENILTFKPSMIQIQQDKRYAKVKKGVYAKQVFRIKAYNQARIGVTLASSGKKILEHLVQEENKMGEIVNNNRAVYPSDVFYCDITLSNGNKAEVKRVNENGTIEILEKLENGTFDKTITEDDIQTYEPGFSFNSNVQQNVKYTANQVSGNYFDNEEDFEVNGDRDEDEKDQDDYGEDKDVAEQDTFNVGIDYSEPTASFKDTQRTFTIQEDLTSRQLKLKGEVVKILKLLHMNEDSINVYTTVDAIEEVIGKIIRELKGNQDIYVTSNVKFIIVCMVLYNLLRVGYKVTLDNVIDKLFPKYLTVKDISTNSMNDNVFLKKFHNLTDDIITTSVKKITEYRKSEKNYTKILKVLLLNCDFVVQDIVGLRVNIDTSSHVRNQDFIAVTGKQERLEAEEEALRNVKSTSQKYAITVKDVLNDNIPNEEVPIFWGESVKVLAKIKNGLTKKYNTTKVEDYLWIRDNLYRGQFALKDLSRKLKTMFMKTLEILKYHIQEQIKITKKNIEDYKESKNEVLRKRKEMLVEEDMQDSDDEDIKNTKSYERTRALREMVSKLGKSNASASRSAYQDIVKNKKHKKESEDVPESEMIEESEDVPETTEESKTEMTEDESNDFPSDKDILKEIRDMISKYDLETLSKKKIRKALSEKFGVDMTHKKDFIYKSIDELMEEDSI